MFRHLDIRTLDPSITYTATPAIRSSPMIADFGEGPTAVFGWMPNPGNGIVARISAVGLRADMAAGTVQFTPRWTVDHDAWKSSVALLPVGTGVPLVVAGYGIGLPENSGTGGYGLCNPRWAASSPSTRTGT
jgi:hypothetical protein